MRNKRTSKPLKINELTSQLFEQKRIKNNILQAQVQNTWEKLMGNNVIKRTNKIFIKENKLIIKLTSAPLKNELNNSKKRKEIVVRYSLDEGINWSKPKIVYSGEAAYSSMTILKNGEIGLFFEKDNYTKNVFTSFSLDWLLN